MRPIAALIAAALLAALPARAAELTVLPLAVGLEEGRISVVSVKNRGAAPETVQVRAKSWGQGPDGAMVLGDAPELIASPPILAIPPGETRDVRVGAPKTGRGDVERAWRLVLTELPAEGDAQIQTLLEITLPVFLAPKAPAPGIRARAEPGGVRISNQGNVTVRGTAFVAADGSEIPGGGYVLPGHEVRWKTDAKPVSLRLRTSVGEDIAAPVSR